MFNGAERFYFHAISNGAEVVVVRGVSSFLHLSYIIIHYCAFQIQVNGDAAAVVNGDASVSVEAPEVSDVEVSLVDSVVKTVDSVLASSESTTEAVETS